MASLPETMTGIVIVRPGGPEVLEPRQVPVPRPGPGQVLLRVAAAGVNRPDVLQRAGAYPPPKGHSELPGLEAAGEVVALGPGVSRWKAGDRLTALLNGGGYAEFCLVEEGSALPLPAGLSLAEAAAIPETYFTVWHNVFERGGLRASEWLLVHGGSSGIGTAAIQLATAFGAKVIATAGSKAKCDACLELGAARAVDYSKEDFVKAVKDATGGKGVEVILDMVGGDYIGRNIEAAAADGRIVQIAFLKSSKVTLDVMPIMLKRLTFTGSTLRIRPNELKARLARALEEKVWPLIAAGRCKPVMDQAFPLAKAADAHRRMEASGHIGKIVLTI
jgi:NADPH2:quinone reductase